MHKLDCSSIATAKNCIGPAIVGAALSPYFAKHTAVVQGLIKLQSLFQWRAAGSNKEDTDLDIRQGTLPPPDAQYLQMMDILYEIWEGIDLAKDGRPSDGVYREARARYEQLLNAGNICERLLGDGSSMLRPASVPRTTSQCSHGSRKRMAEESGESSRMKQARAA